MTLAAVDSDPLAVRLSLIRPHLDERAWRLLLGAEAKVLGRGGVKLVAAAGGVHPDTVAQGVREVDGIEPIPGRVNPYSESLFKMLKYGPEFPECFGSLCDARQFMDIFTNWYNHEHRHTRIGLHTPADVHFGLATDKAAERRAVLADARARHPHRFGTVGTPKILDLPDAAWINRPAQDTTEEPVTAAA